MYYLLLIIIYLAFISLGLPDSLLGSAWPIMHEELNVIISYAGIVSMIIAGGTITSSLISNKLIKKLGAGLIIVISVFMTAFALFGFSTSNAFWMLCLWAIPYGLGAGAIDAALNNYVSLHYSSRHMNWLHCFWGVGATTSPYIMSYFLSNNNNWRGGYQAVFIIQIILGIILLISLPLWKKNKKEEVKIEEKSILNTKETLAIRGVKIMCLTFFAYCAFEATAGLWASSFLALTKGITKDRAAMYASFFYMGIMSGRFLCGLISVKLGNNKMIKIGLITMFIGLLAIIIPFQNEIFALIGLIITGLGCAPMFPAFIHSTPSNFGKENSQTIIGLQMASAYLGFALVPPLFGLTANYLNISYYPYFLLFFALLILTLITIFKKKMKNQ